MIDQRASSFLGKDIVSVRAARAAFASAVAKGDGSRGIGAALVLLAMACGGFAPSSATAQTPAHPYSPAPLQPSAPLQTSAPLQPSAQAQAPTECVSCGSGQACGSCSSCCDPCAMYCDSYASCCDPCSPRFGLLDGGLRDANGRGFLDGGSDLGFVGPVYGVPVMLGTHQGPVPTVATVAGVPGGPVNLLLPEPTATNLTGRTKIAQNGSVVPRSRLFFDYSLLEEEDFGADGYTFHRITPGFEQAFWGGMASLEFRLPVAVNTATSIVTNDPFTEDDSEWGNASIALKGLMFRTPRFAFSGGLQLTLPTADDVTVRLPNGTTVLEVENESYHVMPFIGAVYDSQGLWFAQMFAQFDLDPNGNSVRANPTLTPGGALLEAPDLDDTDLFYLDLATGLWLYRAPAGSQRPLVAFAPTLELHYTQGLDTPEVLRVGGMQLGGEDDSIERLEVVAGASAILRGGVVSAGVAIPATGEKSHDWEFRLMFNTAIR